MGRDQDVAIDISRLQEDVAALLDDASDGTFHDTNESVTVSTTAKALTQAKYGDRAHAIIYVEVAAVRYWANADPTATVGIELSVGDTLFLNSHLDIENVRFIRRDGADATLRCEYGH